MDNFRKLAVLGAGNGGYAMAADLSLGGFEVNLYNRSPERIEPILRRGGIEIMGVARTGFARLNKVTSDMEEAVKGVDVIMVVVPAFGHRMTYEALAPHLEDGQIVVTATGYYGTIEFANILRKKGIKKDVMIGETSVLIYACKVTGPAQVTVTGVKSFVPFAALPAKDTKKVLEVLNKFYPQFVPVKNVLETSLEMLNPILHPSITLLNAGRIESTKGDFLFYIQGATPSVARVIDNLDRERRAVGTALGLELMPAKEHLLKKYEARGETLYETLQDCKPYYSKIETGPDSLTHRYVSEDVPYGLVPMAFIGDLLNVPTPAAKTMINLASLVNQVDYWSEGLTLERLGLAGLSANEIIKWVT